MKAAPDGSRRAGKTRTSGLGHTNGAVAPIDYGLLRQAGQARDSGAFDKAGKPCRLMLKSHSRQTEALHLLAITALESNNFAEADGRFRAVLAINPHSQQALLNPSIALCELGRVDEAGAQCGRALLLNGDRARACAYRGSAFCEAWLWTRSPGSTMH